MIAIHEVNTGNISLELRQAWRVSATTDLTLMFMAISISKSSSCREEKPIKQLRLAFREGFSFL